MRNMILGIDASNIRGGGGVTHLVELLRAANPEEYSFVKVIIWGGTSTLEKIEERGWLKKVNEPLLNKSLIHRIFWQKFILSKLAIKENCDILFIPGGSYSGNFKPFVAMSQNLLPFEWREIKKYGFSLRTIKFILLHISQSITFKKSEGLIFLTEFAKKRVEESINQKFPNSVIISHGIDQRFNQAPKIQKEINKYNTRNPFKILYISTIDAYKNQDKVVEAIYKIKKEGFSVQLDLIGSSYKTSLIKLEKLIKKNDPNGEYIFYRGEISHEYLQKQYQEADLFLFASSCETFGQIVTEAMSAGLPIACSNRSSMKEILSDASVYFDPEDSEDIARIVKLLIESLEQRKNIASISYNKSFNYNWKNCSDKTFSYLKIVSDQHKEKIIV